MIIRINFEKECPIGVNFADDSKSFVVITNYKNIYWYGIEGNDVKKKKFGKNEDFNCSIWSLRYAAHPQLK